MLILYDFRCDDCHATFELLRNHGTNKTECTECGGLATRMISPVRSKLEGITGHFPDAADKWARSHTAAARAKTYT